MPSKKTRQYTIVGSMLGHRLRRWPNIEPTMGECLVFDGQHSAPLQYISQ